MCIVECRSWKTFSRIAEDGSRDFVTCRRLCLHAHVGVVCKCSRHSHASSWCICGGQRPTSLTFLLKTGSLFVTAFQASKPVSWGLSCPYLAILQSVLRLQVQLPHPLLLSLSMSLWDPYSGPHIRVTALHHQATSPDHSAVTFSTHTEVTPLTCL